MTIVIIASPEGWLADFTDDPTVWDLFGTTTIPTAFTLRTSVEDVLAEIRSLNPGATVVAA